MTDYSNCWANPLGDCAGGMSREHHISRSQFGDGMVDVRGFSWCPETLSVGVDRLVASVLCQHHNNSASPLDSAALATMQALQTVVDRIVRMRAGGRREERAIIRVSGDLLERWMLNTTINLALHAAPSPTGGIFDASGRPARRFVDIVYGRGLFGPGEGLMWVAQQGENVPPAQGSIAFNSCIRGDDGALVAAFMRFHGHRLWLATAGAPQIEHGRRPMRTLMANDVNVRIEIEWSRERNRQFREESQPVVA